jgi:hypothetical protein
MPRPIVSGVHISGQLLSHLRLRTPNRPGSLQCSGRSPQLLQPSDPINPNRIRDRCTLRYRCREIGQHLVEPHHQTVR